VQAVAAAIVPVTWKQVVRPVVVLAAAHGVVAAKALGIAPLVVVPVR
jgi:hypothetical protein